VTRDPSAAKRLAAHHAAPDHEHVVRNAFEAEDAVRRHNQRMLHVDSGQPRRLGADTDHQVVELVACAAGDDGITVDEALGAYDCDLASLARRLDSPAHREDDLLLALHHAWEIDLGLRHPDAELSRVANLAEQIGSGQQGLGGDAPPVETGPAELRALDERHIGAELRGTKRGDIPGGATAEHDHPLTHGSLRVVPVVLATDLLWPRCEVANASLTMRSSSSWCDPAYPSEGLARRGRPM